MGMSQEKKIVIIHTSLVSRDLLMSLFQEHIPGISIYNIVDESLLAEVSSAGCVTEGVQSRMNAYVQQAASLDPVLIFNQCSSVGEAFTHAVRHLSIPTLRVDAPMAEKAVSLCPKNGSITVVGTVSSTMVPSTRLVEQKAAEAGKTISVKPVLIDGALDILMKEHDREKHDRLVMQSVRDTCVDSDVIVLAQGSMYEIGARLQDQSKPVLTSPLLGVLGAKQILGL